MKKRNGFVSNSSSSSFMIIGERIGPNDLDTVEGDVYFIGEWLNEGADIFKIEGEFRKAYRQFDMSQRLILAHFVGHDTVTVKGEEFHKLDPNKEYVIHTLDADYHTSDDDIDSFIDRYRPNWS